MYVCCVLIIQMGAVIFAMTDHGETAGDLAQHSGLNEQLLTILHAAEGLNTLTFLVEF